MFEIIGGILLVVLVGALIKKMFPELGVLAKGWTKLFIKEKAVTQRGAEAVFEKKIDDLYELKNKADKSYIQISGKYETAKTNLGKLQARLQKVEADCEDFAKNGEQELLMVKAEERRSIIQQIHTVDELITRYDEAEQRALQLKNQADMKLEAAKMEKEDTLRRMEDNQTYIELTSELNSINMNNNATDKMLEAVREKDKELEELAVGSKKMHQNSLQNKLQIAEKVSYDAETLNYVNSLTAKYNNKNKAAIPVKK